MKQAVKTPSFLVASIAVTFAWQPAGAQEAAESEAPDDELEMIDLEAERDAPDPNEGLDSIEFDEATQLRRDLCHRRRIDI